MIIYKGRTIAIEVKTSTGKQSKEQKLVEERSVKIALLEDLRTILATELELETWRRKNKVNHSHDKIAKDLGITYQASIDSIKRLNRRVKKNLIKLKIRGSSFF
ncbi:hypothetical protein [Cetobacterium sp.]|uniref:hypothetical protein n=1 Tax=Cetobacterium sp. TaxID=2071632 RepID=UPI003F38502F